MTKLKVSDTIDVDITSSYTGYIYNEDQKLWNASERVYSPEMKHFTSMDPEPGNVYEKMRVNAYVYAGNNPTTYIDPDGRFFKEAGEWIGDKISSITDWIGEKVGAASEWITESASELLATYDRVICTIKNPQNQIGLKIIIGTIGLAVGVVATAASGGAVLPILSTAFAATAVGGAMGAASYTISSAVSGAFGLESWNEDDYWTAVKLGASDAYMEFGVTAGVMGYTYYKSGSTTVQYTNEVYYQGNTKADPYDIMKERGIPQTLTDDEISAAKQIELQMNAGKYGGASNKVLGGSFKDVDATRGADEVGHHMPQNAYDKTIGISRNDGPALLMSKEDHALTRTFAGRGKSTMKEDIGLSARQRMAKDLWDIKNKFGTKYNEGIKQMLEYTKTLPEFQK